MQAEHDDEQQDGATGYGQPTMPMGWRHAHTTTRICCLCDTEYSAPYARSGPNYCTPACRSEALHLRRLLAGKTGRYRSVADRLGASTIAGSALDRVLAAAAGTREGREDAATTNPSLQSLRAIAERRVHAPTPVAPQRAGRTRLDRLFPPRPLGQRQLDAVETVESLPGLTVVGLAKTLGLTERQADRLAERLAHLGRLERRPASGRRG